MNITEKILNIKQRGLIKEETDINKLIEVVKNKKTVYCGIDPSCDSLHIGHLVPLKLVKELNDLGCPIIIVIGSITVKIGDPSFRSIPREDIADKLIEKNSKNIKKQILKLIPEVTILDNKEWYKNMLIIDFFSKVGKLFTINKMLERKSIKKAMEKGILFYDNFSYILMQAYDFYYLWKNYNVGIQVGGSDQLPNIIFGIEMINKLEKKEDIKIVGLTTPLLNKTTGKKFSKTDNTNIWLDIKKTRTYDLFQFIYNISDEEAKNWKKLFISEILNQELLDNQKNIQKQLGIYLIKWINNDNSIEKKINNVFETINLKNNFKNIDFQKLIPILGTVEIEENITLINALIKLNIFKSNSDIRRTIVQGGIKIFENKIIDINYKLTKKDSLNGYILLKKGKNNWFIFVWK